MNGLVARAELFAQELAARSDRTKQRARGVVATPAELARAALERVDRLLQSELAIADGLASERVLVVDPAVGTGLWLAALLEATYGRGGGQRTCIGIDVEPASLALAGSLLAPAAAQQGVALELRAANTLELTNVLPPDDTRVLVIVGNPPWAARSLSRGSALSDGWLEEFRRDPEGQPLGERRSGVLSDDYVRFFRWSLEQARLAAGGALLCLATNGSYLDGPVHRGMRGALVRAFDRIELFDLGGSALLSRGAGLDENVFGVRVAAALGLFVRRPGEHTRHALVSYARLRGSRSDKLAALAQGAGALTVHTPAAPWFSLRPRANRDRDEETLSLAEALPFHREGVQTNRDALCIAHTPEALREQVSAFAQGRLRLREGRHFAVAQARAVAQELLEGALAVEPLAYRPFDLRYVLMHPALCHRPRPELAQAVARSSCNLLAVRKERGASPFNLFAASQTLADACFLSTRSSCRTRVFPSHDPAGRENLSDHARERLARRGVDATSTSFIAYVLARLGSPRFRAAHDEQLKLDYARIPLPHDRASWCAAVALGEHFARLLSSAAVGRGSWTVHDRAPLPEGKLHYDGASRTLCAGKRPIATGVEPSLLRACVGHHPIVASALRTRTSRFAEELRAALLRAEGWVDAERQADALWERSGAR